MNQAMRRSESSGPASDCAACGSSARRSSARFCATCGRELGGDYTPAASLRASYHQQRFAVLTASVNGEPAAFLISRPDFLTASAFAFVTFSVVPFVGLLFCPFAIILGLCGMAREVRAPRSRRPVVAVVLAVFISGIQIALWWMLIQIPAGGVGF